MCGFPVYLDMKDLIRHYVFCTVCAGVNAFLSSVVMLEGVIYQQQGLLTPSDRVALLLCCFWFCGWDSVWWWSVSFYLYFRVRGSLPLVFCATYAFSKNVETSSKDAGLSAFVLSVLVVKWTCRTILLSSWSWFLLKDVHSSLAFCHGVQV